MEGMFVKATGIVRKVDELGRIVLPIELRRTLGIEIKDSLEFHIEGNKIVLKKHENSCLFCGCEDSLVKYIGKTVCEHCVKKLSNGEYTR